MNCQMVLQSPGEIVTYHKSVTEPSHKTYYYAVCECIPVRKLPEILPAHAGRIDSQNVCPNESVQGEDYVTVVEVNAVESSF